MKKKSEDQALKCKVLKGEAINYMRKELLNINNELLYFGGGE